MPVRRLLGQRPQAVGADIQVALDALRAELDVPEQFEQPVLAEAERSARTPVLPTLDARHLDLFTVDPSGSRDLDQAMALERGPRGRVTLWYAIADVAAFVRPGGLVDAEAHRRVETLYSPDLRTPLHPPVLSEGAASLLAGVDRPAVLWRLELDDTGEPVSTNVERAMVRSRRQLDYAQVQGALDAGTADESLRLLREVGRLRHERERQRGGVDLPQPEEEVVPPAHEGGAWGLQLRAPVPAEGWNAQISLLTGMAAARLMLDGRVGLLRTLPPPAPEAVAALRRSASGLDVPWAPGLGWTDLLRGLDAGSAPQAALIDLATRLLRGAGYAAFDGEPPLQTAHAGVAAPYAHVTAPLRRLADRYAAEVCVALCAGMAVPDWVRAALPTLPGEMSSGGRRSAALERAVVDLVEACLLQGREGETFPAMVVELRQPDAGTVQLHDPPVRGQVRGQGLELGTHVEVRLLRADPGARLVEFAVG